MYLRKVEEFHQVFAHPVMNMPAIPSSDRCLLRYNLLEEELKEFKQAIVDGDIIAAADALCDLQYVLSGAVLEFGLKEKFDACFNEVHRSNMSKACTTEDEADRTVGFFHDAYKVQRGAHWFVYRISDNKTLKSVDYSKADLVRIIHG